MRVGLITGAASGIGLATAQRLAAGGYHTLLWDKDGAQARAAAKALTAAGHRAEALEIDVSDVAAVKAAVQAVARRGALDAVVACAGISGHGVPFAEIDEARYDAMMNTHVRGHFFLLQALLPAFAAGAAIVLVSSIFARSGAPNMPHYVAAKGALLGLAKGLATELGPRGIRVNAVTPGLIRTWDPLESTCRHASLSIL